MEYFKICPNCGATLDPGESCTCKKVKPISELTPEECREEINAEVADIERPFVLQNILKVIRILKRKGV